MPHNKSCMMIDVCCMMHTHFYPTHSPAIWHLCTPAWYIIIPPNTPSPLSCSLAHATCHVVVAMFGADPTFFTLKAQNLWIILPLHHIPSSQFIYWITYCNERFLIVATNHKPKNMIYLSPISKFQPNGLLSHPLFFPPTFMVPSTTHHGTPWPSWDPKIQNQIINENSLPKRQ